jgi:hypothetical protein
MKRTMNIQVPYFYGKGGRGENFDTPPNSIVTSRYLLHGTD